MEKTHTKKKTKGKKPKRVVDKGEIDLSATSLERRRNRKRTMIKQKGSERIKFRPLESYESEKKSKRSF